MSTNGSEESKTTSFSTPLPLGISQSTYGLPEDWPPSLQAYTLTVAAFSYPAALFWGEELVRFHNLPWAELSGDSQQGQKQRTNISPDAYAALSAAQHGGKPKRVDASELLPEVMKGEEHTVLISPLFEESNVAGLLVQLYPKLMPAIPSKKSTGEPSSETQEQAQPSNADQLDISELGSVIENLPIDEHPFFNRFAQLLPCGLAILDHKAQAVFVNQQFWDLTTHHDEEKAFMSWPNSIHPDDYDRVMDAYKQAFTSQERLRTEFRALGDEHPWRLLLLTPLGDENLRHVSLRDYGGFVCSLVDISSEKSAELTERKAADAARNRKTQQERFMDMVSHEIRNPLGAILHCAEDIDEAVRKPATEIDTAAIHEAIDTISLCITHQKQIVDDVLNFSKLDANMLSLTPSPCQPRTGLERAVKIFHPEFRKQSIQYNYQVDPSYREHDVSWVCADLARITQVVVNLISNAIKFTAKVDGEKRLTVSIGASIDRPASYPADVVTFHEDEHDSGQETDVTDNEQSWGSGSPVYILIAVKDTGIGIDEEGQRSLFQRFSQIVPKTSEIYGGSGLGLNISRQLCHLHGGEIGVHSRKGTGSTFSFFFKARRCGASEASLSQQDGNVKAGSEEMTLTLNPAATKLHVLLVEDNMINQRIVSRKLTSQGFRVTAANNGREAVDKLMGTPQHPGGAATFDIVLMDQEMPVLDGNAATKEIRQRAHDDRAERVPILGVTANARSEQRDDMIEAGMDDVISKPYRIEELVAKINAVTTGGEKERG